MGKSIDRLEVLRELRSALAADEVTAAKAKEVALDGAGSWKRTWRSKAWKARRNELLEGQCALCENSDGPFVLQHLWHPADFAEIICRHLPPPTYGDYKAAFTAEHGAPPTEFEITRIQPTCPRCGSTNIYFRKRSADYRCSSRVRKVRCNHVFATPVERLTVDRTATASVKQTAYREYERLLQAHREMRFESPPEAALRAALLDYLDEGIRYLSCEDTCTMCKRCAFLWDQRGYRPCRSCGELAGPGMLCSRCDPDMRLCTACGEKWHRAKYPTCMDCS